MRNVDVDSDSDDNSDYAFVVRSVNDQSNDGVVSLDVGGVHVNLLVDSGATVNVIDKKLWEAMKAKKVKCTSKVSSKPLHAYGGKPLTVIGCFEANVVTDNGTNLQTQFFVINENAPGILGKDAATKLGLLHIGIPERTYVNQVDDQKAQWKSKFPDCFSGFGKLKDYQLKVPIDTDVTPVIHPLRRIPYHLRDKLERKLDELVAQDIIEKVNEPSPWISPVVVVPKKNDIRLCVDMRQANQAVIRERYPIPTVEEVLQDFNQSTVFSKLDIKLAYHQIELDPSSREITTFMTHKGMYRYKRLMFGISCAPEMYNKILQQTLDGCDGVQSIFDDIVVHGKTQAEHDKHLEATLQRLCEKGLTLNIDKCQFNMSHIEFMGHILSEHGVGLAKSKVEAVQNARQPKSVSEVRSFLGLVNFSGRFIPNLATIAEPLRKLTRNGVPFNWGPEQTRAFDELKTQLSNASILGYYDPTAQTLVITDASPVGLGAVLAQKHGDDYRVIMYASRSLTDVERRYSQTEKEALGLVWGCERFRMYLIGTQFELWTDHRPLECIFAPKSKPSARIERWVLRLQSFNYTVKYISGNRNVADSLSRLLPDSVPKETNNRTEEYIRNVAIAATPTALTTREIERASETDEELIDIRNCLISGQWERCQFKEYIPVRNELSAIGQVVLRGTRIVVPKSLRPRVLELGHEGHPGIVVMKRNLRTKVWWPGIDRDAEKECRSCYGCQLVGVPTKPEPMQRTKLPDAPWEHLAADFLGPLPSGESLFVLVDYYSRWKVVEVMKSTTAEKTVKYLKEVFSVYGLPLSITTDNGPQFISDTFAEYMRENGIQHRRITPLWPQANGQVERQNRSFMKRIRIAHSEGKNWREEINTYLMMYRSSPHSVTGISPAELMFGRKMRTKIPQISDFTSDDIEVRDRDSEEKEKGKDYSDSKRKAVLSDIVPGDKVLVKQNRENKLSPSYRPEPMTVTNKQGSNVTVETNDGVQYDRNVTHVKKFVEKPSSEQTSSDQSVDTDTDYDLCAPTETEHTDVSDEAHVRPQRTKKIPVRFKDYVMDK